MSPLVGSPLTGSPDYQQVDNWDGPPLAVGTVESAGPMKTLGPWIASRYANIWMQFTPNSAAEVPLIVYLVWSENKDGTGEIATESFAIGPIGEAPESSIFQCQFANRGPWVRIQVLTPSGQPFSSEYRIAMNNRQLATASAIRTGLLIPNTLVRVPGGETQHFFYPRYYYSGQVAITTYGEYEGVEGGIMVFDSELAAWVYAITWQFTPPANYVLRSVPVPAGLWRVFAKNDGSGSAQVVIRCQPEIISIR